jgi:hypothetical protein
MHLLLPPSVGEEDFCVVDVSTVHKANGGMSLPFLHFPCWTESYCLSIHNMSNMTKNRKENVY